MSDFDKLNRKINQNNCIITYLEKSLREIKSNNKKLKEQLYQVCDHEFVRECTTTGCYAEYHNICKKCGKWN